MKDKTSLLTVDVRVLDLPQFQALLTELSFLVRRWHEDAAMLGEMIGTKSHGFSVCAMELEDALKNVNRRG